MIALLAAALASALAPPLSLVVATSGMQDQPRPAPCGPNGDCDDFHYRSTFTEARNIVGIPLDAAFEARLKLHTPYISRYRLALIVERQADGSLLVLRQAGFNGRTGVACFDNPGEQTVDWQPAAPDLRMQGKILCLFDARQIDARAPRN